MKLENPFSQDTRLLYLYRYDCDFCGGNGNGVGGLELHHITGRYSNSPFNASVLCKECHAHIGHSQSEEKQLFAKNFIWLYNSGYNPNEDDLLFVKSNYQRLFTRFLEKWLENLHSKNQNQKNQISKEQSASIYLPKGTSSGEQTTHQSGNQLEGEVGSSEQ